MSIQTEIDRISTAVQNAHLKVIEKGGTSTAPYLVANLASAIDTIPEATEPKLQAKTATPSETAQTVKPDSGYDGLSSVAVGAISKTYVGSSVPKQAAQTITPGTADKTIASGKYLTGTQTIKGDANLMADNIKSGVSIFGVAGSFEGSGGGAAGGSLDTCTVTLKGLYGAYIHGYAATVVNNGAIETAYEYQYGATNTERVIENVLCGSILVLMGSTSSYFTRENGGVTKVGSIPYQSIAYRAPETAGASGLVEFYSNV